MEGRFCGEVRYTAFALHRRPSLDKLSHRLERSDLFHRPCEDQLSSPRLSPSLSCGGQRVGADAVGACERYRFNAALGYETRIWRVQYDQQRQQPRYVTRLLCSRPHTYEMNSSSHLSA